MDTLSASATTTAANFKRPTSVHHVKATSSLLPPAHQHYHLSSAPKTTTGGRRSLTKSTSTPVFLSTLKPTTTTRTPLKQPPQQPVPVHRRAASGYAAALLDAAQLGGSATLAAVTRDIRRFSKLLRRDDIRDFMGDGSLEERDKGGLLKTIAERGMFHGQLKVLLNLLIEKGKSGIVGEVLDEFERIYMELRLGRMETMIV